jgi:inorganic pyrophosphatase
MNASKDTASNSTMQNDRLFPQHQAHPWHGITQGKGSPQIVNTFVEIVPTDTVKYEIDKASGHLRIDRPQRYSNQCPTLYGFIPRTYCGAHIGARCSEQTGKQNIQGDGDPLDICIFTDRPIAHGNIIVAARPIGGLRMIDGDEADDKILAVLDQDSTFGGWKDISDCPSKTLDRLKHYFLTYKDLPGTSTPKVEIAEVYNAAEAYRVIELSSLDYQALIAT